MHGRFPFFHITLRDFPEGNDQIGTGFHQNDATSGKGGFPFIGGQGYQEKEPEKITRSYLGKAHIFENPSATWTSAAMPRKLYDVFKIFQIKACCKTIICTLNTPHSFQTNLKKLGIV